VQRSSQPKPKTVKAIDRRRRRTYFAVQKEDSTDDRPSGSSNSRSGKTWKTHDSWVSRLKRKELVLLQKTDAMGKQKGDKRECVPSTQQEQVATIPTRPYPSDRNFRGQMRHKHKPAVSGCPAKARKTTRQPYVRQAGHSVHANRTRKIALEQRMRSVNIALLTPCAVWVLTYRSQLLGHFMLSTTAIRC